MNRCEPMNPKKKKLAKRCEYGIASNDDFKYSNVNAKFLSLFTIWKSVEIVLLICFSNRERSRKFGVFRI